MHRALSQSELLAQGKRRCSRCKKIKTLDQFYKDKKAAGGVAYRCRPCTRLVARRDYHGNRERRLAVSKVYREKPEIRRSTRHRALMKKYSITLTDYESLLDMQGGVCAICRTDTRDGRERDMPVDHDHATGQVRGILCDRCNRTIGLFQDDPEIIARAITYLRKWEKKP